MIWVLPGSLNAFAFRVFPEFTNGFRVGGLFSSSTFSSQDNYPHAVPYRYGARCGGRRGVERDAEVRKGCP